jgi:hypothetical protein
MKYLQKTDRNSRGFFKEWEYELLKFNLLIVLSLINLLAPEFYI